MSAILFGSISTLADTSEIQRRAFNEAFEAHRLGWNWSQEDYRSMLGSNGGAGRIAEYASARGDDVDSAAVHATKCEIFQKLLADSGVSPRPGVTQTLDAAKEHGLRVGLVTTTSPDNVAALLDALTGVDRDSFDIVVDSTSVEQGKPDPASYLFALDQLGEKADQCVAIEDNVGGVHAASAASVSCVAFPNENTAGSDFSGAVITVESLDAEHIRALIGSGK